MEENCRPGTWLRHRPLTASVSFFSSVTLNLTGEQTVVSLLENEKFIISFPISVLHLFFPFLASWNLQTVPTAELPGILASPGFNSGAFHGVKLPR